MDDREIPPATLEVPRVPASAGALIFDAGGRLLVLNPTYTDHWTIPGGQIEGGGETPWEACCRETFEECGLAVVAGRLVCVDFLRPRPRRDGGVRFLFHCGSFDGGQLAAITLQAEEISEHRFVELAEAEELLSGPLRRRVLASAGAKHCIYLEEGRPIDAVRA